MQRQKLVRAASVQNICAFCALRLSNICHPAVLVRRDGSRQLSTSSGFCRPPGAAFAVAETDDSTALRDAVGQAPRPTKPTPNAWPKFVPKTTTGEVQPDDRPPDPPPATSSWKCGGCGNVNLGRRNVCLTCRRPKDFLASNSLPQARWPPSPNPTPSPSGSRSHLVSGPRNIDPPPPFQTSRASSTDTWLPSTGSAKYQRENNASGQFASPPAPPTDSGDRSGLESLLEYARKPTKPPSQNSFPNDLDWPASRTPSWQRDTSQTSRLSPAQQSSGRRSNFQPYNAGSHAASPNIDTAEATMPSRFRSETAVPRVRGRFTVDAEEGDESSSAVTKQAGFRKRTKDRKRDGWRPSEGVFDDPDEVLAELSNRRRKTGDKKKGGPMPIQLPEFISVDNLATALRMRTGKFISTMEEMGFDRPRQDHILDAETSGLIVSELNYEPIFGPQAEVPDLVAQPAPEDASGLPPRPPIVTIMGHVDHGKTTILDWLRKSSVAASEHGGITQHIGAFSVQMPGGKQITFLDTPGHAAFLDMRRRGATVTDIVILVVAADDSVKPQTVEAIKHATDAKVPVIVAINKIDKGDANAMVVKQDLARHGITVEAYGGDVQAIEVSGKLGQGMRELEEAAVTLSEVLDHRAAVEGAVEGWIIESNVSRGGRIATVLVRRGTLRPGDIIMAGTTWARVRNLRNDAGVLVEEARPGTPVQIDGWRGDDPQAGQEVLQAEDEEQAKAVLRLRQDRAELNRLAEDATAINTTRAQEAEAREAQLAWEAKQEWAKKRPGLRPKDNAGWVERRATGGPLPVHFVVKADVSGSVEAVVNSISAIGNNEVAANVVRSGVGLVNESDVHHLASSGEMGYLVSFNQPVDGAVARLAQTADLEILDHSIIYKLIDTVKDKVEAELPPLVTSRVVGEAEIGKIFEISVKRQKIKIAGCRIHNGLITRGKKVRVLRGTQVIYDGSLSSLKNVKKDVKEMRKGSECGMGFERWDGFEEGDQVQCYEEHTTKRHL